MTQNVQYKRADDKDNGRPPFDLATCDGWVTVLPYGIGYQSGSVQSVLGKWPTLGNTQMSAGKTHTMNFQRFDSHMEGQQ